MKNILLLLLLCCFACKNQTKQNVVEADANPIESAVKSVDTIDLMVYNFDELEPFFYQDDDKVHVINFWATWCAPCVKELPHFEKLKTEYASKNLDVLLVSLDFEQAYETKLKPFIVEHNIQSKVVVLNDPDSNSWIPKISDSWSGSIPATIIYNKDKRQFYEQTFTYDELEAEVNKFL
ncbi:TlpA family protein disulfide reductase [Formosa sp. PL04]|uniref:TlpA family protein disulfide reductase n=1 Tax=Formosa sp. PL04 TaxID=3081755 RepID=UPI002980C67B|nr:TlpA family protein disulfide reductase [Formosa sp. PL04]MDW5290482.1 TlpA family protein disulfide reductase [Formosa sp. PL04]